ncbi:MAG: glycosyl transferase family 2 [Planctomycetes bacterium]|nr:glycosyl transferase family 2 [Planctomycetota bacterium]
MNPARTPKALDLEPHLQQFIEKQKSLDIVVGIPSFHSGRTVAHVIRAVECGLRKYFSNYSTGIVISDGSSTDDTESVCRLTQLPPESLLRPTDTWTPIPRIFTRYSGIPGKGSALRTIFEVAHRLHARAVAVVDSDLRSITAEWVELLLGPILWRDHDYCCPLYARHKYDGTITNSLVYPLVRALYRRNVRQPIGGDFGFSSRILEKYVAADVWESDVARFGIDIWMTTTALVNSQKVCQVFLGSKIHDPKDPGAHLSGMLQQVTSAVFSRIVADRAVWSTVDQAKELSLFGLPFAVGLDPIHVDVERMVATFEQALVDLLPMLEAALRPETLRGVRALAGQKPRSFVMPTELWRDIVFDYLTEYATGRLPQNHLLPSLFPLYLGRTASWVRETERSSASEVEAKLEELCISFDHGRRELLARWPGEQR